MKNIQVENEMGGTCSIIGGVHIGYWWKSQKEIDHCHDQAIDGLHNIKMDLVQMGWRGVAQDRYRWRALVNAVMKLRVP
jgi:hypothetical protein